VSYTLSFLFLLIKSIKYFISYSAEASPYEYKDILKARGYRWNDGSNNKAKAWFIEVSEQLKEEELNFLYQEIYKSKPVLKIEEITPYNRFSIR
jgi:DNA polymerase-3 subunit epsilon